MERQIERKIQGERVFLKKRATGYTQVYPIVIDGKFSWKNFLTGGTYAHLIRIAIIVLLICAVAWAYNHDAQAFREINEKPCDYLARAQIDCWNSGGSVNYNNIKVEYNEKEVIIK
jgi:hypothetical protein